MDFARKQLLKYGWSEGKGLGRNENGISEALKPTLKFDTTGVGHDSSEQFTFNWWENVYNNAADNIEVEKTNSGSVKVKLNSDDSVDITTKKYSHKHLKKKNNLEYGCFLKTSKLTAEGVVDHEDKDTSSTNESVEFIKVKNLTDEELFNACGGRTAHKGARHGLKQNGKLARIQEQEMLLLQKMKQQANNLNKDENKTDNKYSIFENNEYEMQKKVKNKKKKRSTEKTGEAEEKQEKAKKRKHSETENLEENFENFIEEEAERKRTEYICSKKEKQKRKESSRISKMANMFENVCVLNSQQDNKDDGFVENTNEEECETQVRKKHKKKKRKLNDKKVEKDDGFEECINEVSEKLIFYKELRRDLQKEKWKGDDKRISVMVEEFEKAL